MLKAVPFSEEAGFMNPPQPPPLQFPRSYRSDTAWTRQRSRSTDNNISSTQHGLHTPSQYPNSLSVDYFYKEHIPRQPFLKGWSHKCHVTARTGMPEKMPWFLKTQSLTFFKIQRPVEKVSSRNFNYSVGIIHPVRPCIYGDNTKD